MRFLFKALLAATALIPAAASAQEGPDRGPGRERPGRGPDGGNGPRGGGPGAEGPRGDWRAQANVSAGADVGQRRWEGRAERGPGEMRPQPPGRGDDGGANRPARQWEGRRDGNPGIDRPTPQIQVQPQQWDGRRDVRPDARGDGARNWNGRTQGDRDWNDRIDRNWGDRNRPEIDPGRGDGRFGDRNGWNRPAPDAQRDGRRFDDRRGWNGQWNTPGRVDNRGAWNRTWRNDNRYDWNRYRTQNRYAYRLPRYYAPSGWGYGYRQYSVGSVLNQLLWGENYWIEDPYSYRLPQAYGPYRWVRYYDDALLVDIRTGRVVDVVNGIFW